MQALKSGFCGKVSSAAVAPAVPEAEAPEDAPLDGADAALVVAALLAALLAAALVVLDAVGALPHAVRTRPAAAMLAISVTPWGRRTVGLLLGCRASRVSGSVLELLGRGLVPVGRERDGDHSRAAANGRRSALRGPYSGVDR